MRSPALLVAALALFLAACGETEIDAPKAESFISDTVTEQAGARVESVECPEGLKAEKGATFECTVTGDDGSSGRVSVTEKDDEGNVTVTQPFLPVRQLEASITEDIARQTKVEVQLECPEIVTAEKGGTYDCEATIDGQQQTVRVTQKDADANVRYELQQ